MAGHVGSVMSESGMVENVVVAAGTTIALSVSRVISASGLKSAIMSSGGRTFRVRCWAVGCCRELSGWSAEMKTMQYTSRSTASLQALYNDENHITSGSGFRHIVER